MSEDRASEDAPSQARPSTALAGAAAALPIVFATVGCLVMPLAAGSVEGLTRMAEEMGAWFYVILLVTPLAAVVAGVCLFLAGRGMRVPAALAIGAAALPWICGIAGARTGAAMVEEAVAFASPSSRAALLARGIAESLNARLFGSWLGAALLSGVGLGLALAALGQRAPRRSLAGAAVGVAAAVPLLGLSIYPLVGGAGLSGALVLLPGLGALLALAFAGAAAGDDAQGRSAALAAGAPVAMVLAVVAAATTATSAGVIEAFTAIAVASPGSRMMMLARAAEELEPLTLVSRWGGLVGLLSIVAVAGWAVTRSTPSAGRIVGAAAVVLCAAAVPGLDAWATSASSESLSAGMQSPWAEVEGFEPIVFERSRVEARSPKGVVTPEGAFFEGERVPLERGALEARFRELLARDLARGASDAPDWLKRPGGGAPGGAPGEPMRPPEHLRPPDPELDEEPTLAIAVDARLPTGALRTVLEAAGAAGAHSVQAVGRRSEPLAPEQAARLREVMPLIATLDRGTTGATEVLLPTVLPEGYAARDRNLHHAEVGADPAVRVEQRPEAPAQPFELAPSGVGGGDFGRGGFGRGGFGEAQPKTVVYLRIGDGATARSVLTAAHWVHRKGHRPLLVTGELPADPAEPAAQPEQPEPGGLGLGGLADDDGTIGLGNAGGIGTLGHGSRRAPEGDVEGGEAQAMGSLSKDVIQRVIRRHASEMRYCYERELASKPKLTGKVTVKMTIGSNGKVQDAEIERSTLGSPAAEQCITRRVRGWIFPAPQGGGVVVVRYPFIFRAG